MKHFRFPFFILIFSACTGTNTQQLLDTDFSGFDRTAPTFIYPANDAPLPALTQTLVWTPKSGAGRYTLRIFTDAARTNLLNEYKVVGNSLTLSFPDSKTYYYSLAVLGSPQQTLGAFHVLDAIYVYCPAGTTCDDTGRVGTKNLPYQTLEGAATKIQQLDVSLIRIAARDATGTAAYTQTTVALGNGKSAYGGYDAEFLSQAPTVYKTIIANVSTNQAVMVFSGITKKTIIDGLTLRGFTSIEYSAQALRFQNNTFEYNGSTGSVILTNSSSIFRGNLFRVNVQGSGMTGIFVENTFNVSDSPVISLATNSGVNHSRPIIIGNTFYNSGAPAGGRIGIKISPAQSSAVIMKNFLNPGASSAACTAIQLDQSPLNVLISGNTIAMANAPAPTGVSQVLEFVNTTGGTSNMLHNNILLSNGAAANYAGYEDATSNTPELLNNLAIPIGGGAYNKWLVTPPATIQNFDLLPTGNITTGSLASHFVDWDGADNNSSTPDNNQALLTGSTALNQGLGCGSLTTRNQVWGFAGSQADCTLRFPGSAYSFGQCESIHLKDTIEILDDNIGNENGLCEANETCLYNPNMGAYWGHGALIDTGCNVSGVIAGVTLKKYAQNGY